MGAFVISLTFRYEINREMILKKPAQELFICSLRWSYYFSRITNSPSEVWPTEIEWFFMGCYRATHAAFQGNRANINKLFPKYGNAKFSVKAAMLADVPVKERYFATSQEMKLFRYRSWS